MENLGFNIYIAGLSKQYWLTTLIKCRNLLLTDIILFNKWVEASGDDGTGLKKLIVKFESATNSLNLSSEETTIAYFALTVIHQYLELFLKNISKEKNLENLQIDGAFHNVTKWQVFALNAFEELYFNEDFPSYISSVIHANMILREKETLLHQDILIQTVVGDSREIRTTEILSV